MELKPSFELPTAEEYVNLRILTGLSPRDVKGAEIGLVHSNHMVTFRDKDKLVGMGRVIGDGATTFQIVDIAVHSDYQGKGIGKKIMEELMLYLKKNATSNAYVSLMADGDAKYLYKKFGFEETYPYSSGMCLFMK